MTATRFTARARCSARCPCYGASWASGRFPVPPRGWHCVAARVRAADFRLDLARVVAPSASGAGGGGAGAARVALDDEPIDVVGNVTERDERRDGVLCSHVKLVLEREDKLRQGERVELDLLEQRVAREPLGRQLEVAHDNVAKPVEGRCHARVEAS